MIVRFACVFLMLMVGCAETADPPLAVEDTESHSDEVRMRGGVSIEDQIERLDATGLKWLARLMELPELPGEREASLRQRLVIRAVEAPVLAEQSLGIMKTRVDTAKNSTVALQIRALDRDELIRLARIVDIPVQDESEAEEIAQSLVDKAAESPELVRRALTKLKNQHDTLK